MKLKQDSNSLLLSAAAAFSSLTCYSVFHPFLCFNIICYNTNIIYQFPFVKYYFHKLLKISYLKSLLYQNHLFGCHKIPGFENTKINTAGKICPVKIK